MTQTVTSKEVAGIINQQIGRQAFAMMGTDLKFTGHDSLTFNIKGSKIGNRMKVRLADDDTYSIELYKIRGANFTVVDINEGIHVDQLHQIIESMTGLYLGMGAR